MVTKKLSTCALVIASLAITSFGTSALATSRDLNYTKNAQGTNTAQPGREIPVGQESKTTNTHGRCTRSGNHVNCINPYQRDNKR